MVMKMTVLEQAITGAFGVVGVLKSVAGIIKTRPLALLIIANGKAGQTAGIGAVLTLTQMGHA